jgi:hypothetical protein
MNKKIKKIAIYPGYSSMLKDQIFNINSESGKNHRGLPILQRYVALKDFLEKKGMELHTFDMYGDFHEIDLWLMLEANPRGYFFIAKNFINPKKVIPIIIEPPVVSPWEWKYVRYWSRLHKIVLTWSPDLVKENKRFARFHYMPFVFDATKYDYFKSKPKKNMCLLMQSNKASRVRGELYSLRRDIVRYFEKRGDNLFDLYGHGWNNPSTHHLGKSKPFYTTVYKGIAEDKWETFSEYSFIFCIQNAIPAGDFECDAFMSMATGAVPIYLPPPDAGEYIPSDTYISYNNFKNLDELTSYLQSIIGTKEYEQYRQRGWEYINSEKFRPFTVEQFSEDVYGAIKKFAE